MSVASKWGALTVWRVESPQAASVIVDGLLSRPFRRPALQALTSKGFTAMQDISLDPSFDQTVIANLVAFAYRVDTKKIPAPLKALMIEQKCREWMQEHARAKVPPSVRQQITEDVTVTLTTMTPPTPMADPLLLDLHTGRLFVGTVKPAVLDDIAKALADIGLVVDRRTVLDELANLGSDDARAVFGLSGYPVAEDDDPKARRKFEAGAAGGFLAWLWHRYQAASGGLPKVAAADVDWAWGLEKGLSIDDENGEPRLVLHHAEAASDPALKLALLDGSRVSGATVEIHVSDIRQAALKLVVKEGELRIAGLDFHIPKHGDPLERALSIGFDLDRTYDGLLVVLSAYGQLRADPDRRGQAEASMRRWLQYEMGSWAASAGVAVLHDA